MHIPPVCKVIPEHRRLWRGLCFWFLECDCHSEQTNRRVWETLPLFRQWDFIAQATHMLIRFTMPLAVWITNAMKMSNWESAITSYLVSTEPFPFPLLFKYHVLQFCSGKPSQVSTAEASHRQWFELLAGCSLACVPDYNLHISVFPSPISQGCHFWVFFYLLTSKSFIMLKGRNVSPSTQTTFCIFTYILQNVCQFMCPENTPNIGILQTNTVLFNGRMENAFSQGPY